MAAWWAAVARRLAGGRDRPAPAALGQPLKLVVGLGNPGRNYAGTRHNVGFEVLELLAVRHRAGRVRRRFQGQTAECSLAGHRLLLLQPETYMNLSGRSVREAVAFYKLDLASLLVVCDDLNLPAGKLRFRRGGSDGGHRGLRSICQQLGTEQFQRLRIGVGPLPDGWDAAEFVLARFSRQQRAVIDQAVQRAAEAVALWCSDGIDACMNRFN